MTEIKRPPSAPDVDYPRGGPGSPMDGSRLQAKFRRLTEGCWSPARRAQVIAGVEALDGDGLRALAEILKQPA